MIRKRRNENNPNEMEIKCHVFIQKVIFNLLFIENTFFLAVTIINIFLIIWDFIRLKLNNYKRVFFGTQFN